MDAIKQLPKLKPIYTTGTTQSCNSQENNWRTFHGICCDSSTPKWDGYYVMALLSPSIFMEELTKMSRTVVIGEYWHVITWNT